MKLFEQKVNKKTYWGEIRLTSNLLGEDEIRFVLYRKSIYGNIGVDHECFKINESPDRIIECIFRKLSIHKIIEEKECPTLNNIYEAFVKKWHC